MVVRAEMIRRYGHRCLRRVARPVDPSDRRTRDLLDALWASLLRDGGVGLAAPQIDHGFRVAVVLDPDRPRSGQRIELVNPEIRETFGPIVPFEEGCLSFPGLYTTVMRPQGVEVVFDGPEGPRTLRDEGLAARIIQHEIDHLDGVLFIDHLPLYRRIILLPRLIPFAMTEVWRKLFGMKRGA